MHKNNIVVCCLLAIYLNCDGKLLHVTNLSAWSRYENHVSHGISKACFHPLKIIKVLEWKSDKKNVKKMLKKSEFISNKSKIKYSLAELQRL